MTIDERLERLTGRHEALTQTVEVIAGMQRENEKQIGELAIFIRQLSEIAAASR
jgi:hypothetical protein